MRFMAFVWCLKPRLPRRVNQKKIGKIFAWFSEAMISHRVQVRDLTHYGLPETPSGSYRPNVVHLVLQLHHPWRHIVPARS